MTTVRPAVAADAAAIAVLCSQLGYPAETRMVEERLTRLAASAGHAVFVAERDGRVQGWVHVATTLTVEYAPRAELLGLVVDAQARSGGLGAALTGAAEDWARAQGHAEMVVRSRQQRERAHAFYRRQGYTDWKQQAVFVKPL